MHVCFACVIIILSVSMYKICKDSIHRIYILCGGKHVHVARMCNSYRICVCLFPCSVRAKTVSALSLFSNERRICLCSVSFRSVFLKQIALSHIYPEDGTRKQIRTMRSYLFIFQNEQFEMHSSAGAYYLHWSIIKHCVCIFSGIIKCFPEYFCEIYCTVEVTRATEPEYYICTYNTHAQNACWALVCTFVNQFLNLIRLAPNDISHFRHVCVRLSCSVIALTESHAIRTTKTQLCHHGAFFPRTEMHARQNRPPHMLYASYVFTAAPFIWKMRERITSSSFMCSAARRQCRFVYYVLLQLKW